MAVCNGNCLSCKYDDCVSDSPPRVCVDEYLQFGLDFENRHMPSCYFFALDPGRKVLPERIYDRNLSGAECPGFQAWCHAHDVVPRSAADVEILKRAIQGGFEGRKLQKALYKVRHRDLYLAQKRRNKLRKRISDLERSKSLPT